MCGLAGILQLNKKPVEQTTLEKMSEILQHRGPDGAGFFLQGHLGLVHRRLSILDLSEAGHQPMTSSNERFVITYNGEIFNFKEVRSFLEQKGHRFRSRSDTEVLLEGLQSEGLAILERLVGMFAFALWDRQEQCLTVVRDRLGIKPLYYYQDKDRFVFGSEIKALFCAGVPKELNAPQLQPYLSLRYIPGEQTIFKNIYKLEPGTWLQVNSSGVIQKKKFWSLLDFSELESYGEKEAQERFFSLLDASVAGAMVADVPVGSFLSGGIDSSAITALMKKHQGNINTFTFSMGGEIDESERARQIASHLQVDNEVVMKRPDDYLLYSKALWHLEEPLGDSIIVPTLRLAEAANKKLKVVLLGEGADEILGGYVHQLALQYSYRFKEKLPAWLVAGAGKAVQMLPLGVFESFFPYPAKLGPSGFAKLTRFLGKKRDFGDDYLSLASVFSPLEQETLLEKDYFLPSSSASPAELFQCLYVANANPVFLNRLCAVDLKYWNTDYGMLRMDKLTMAYSLEARVPYLDHRLVEFCLRLPAKYKMRLLQQKRLLRESVGAKNILPCSVVRAKKQAFYLPAEKSTDNAAHAYLRDTLSSSKALNRGIFRKPALRALVDNPTADLLRNKQLMSVFLFELWAELFLDK